MDTAVIVVAVVASAALVAITAGVRVVAEHERALVLRLGRRGPLLGPGPHLLYPLGIDRLRRVDMRTCGTPLPPQEVVTADGAPLRVGAVVHDQVLDPMLALTRVVDHRRSTIQLAQGMIREAFGTRTLREALLEEDALRTELISHLQERVEPWGVRIASVDLLQVDLAPSIREAISRRAEWDNLEEAERLRTDIELTAARRQVAVARVLAEQPLAAQLHHLERIIDALAAEARVEVHLPAPGETLSVDLRGRRGGAASIREGPPSREPPPGPSIRRDPLR